MHWQHVGHLRQRVHWPSKVNGWQVHGGGAGSGGSEFQNSSMVRCLWAGGDPGGDPIEPTLSPLESRSVLLLWQSKDSLSIAASNSIRSEASVVLTELPSTAKPSSENLVTGCEHRLECAGFIALASASQAAASRTCRGTCSFSRFIWRIRWRW
jgi:hypothetical protein